MPLALSIGLLAWFFGIAGFCIYQAQLGRLADSDHGATLLIGFMGSFFLLCGMSAAIFQKFGMRRSVTYGRGAVVAGNISALIGLSIIGYAWWRYFRGSKPGDSYWA